MVYIIFILAFFIRLIYIIQLKFTIFYSNFLLDEAFYDNWARNIASGNWLGEGLFDALPLYPYLLGIIYKFTGYNLLIPRIIEGAVSSFSCVLIYFITKRLFNSKSAGIIAGLIACFYGPFIFYSGIFAATTFVVFLYLSALWLLIKVIEKPTLLRFFSFGLVVGVAALTRAGILLFLPAVLIWMIVSNAEKKKAVAGAFIALLGVLAVISPVTWRNYKVSGDIVFLTSHAGLNFYIGNNEDADGTFKEPYWARSNIEGLKVDSKTIAEQEMGEELKESEVSRFYFGKGVRFIRERPLMFLRLLGRKLFLFLNKQELFDTANYQVYREYIPVLKLPFITFLIVGPLGLAGLCVAISRWREIAPLYLFVITYTVSILLYFVNSRYRVLFAAVMVIFTGFFISWWFEKWRQERYFAVSMTSGLCALLFLVVSLPTGIETTSTGYTNLGNIFIQAKEWDKAVGAFYKAIEFNDTKPKPYNDIGYAYIQQGKLKEAEPYLLTSLSRDSYYPFAHINMGLLYEKRGNLTAAENEYEQAIRINPNIPQAHNNLANIYGKARRHSSAIREYKRAIKLDPTNAKTHYNLGVIYGRSGRVNEAKEEFEKAASLDPEFTPVQEALRYFKK